MFGFSSLFPKVDSEQLLLYWALLRLDDVDIYVMPSPEGMTTKYLPSCPAWSN